MDHLDDQIDFSTEYAGPPARGEDWPALDFAAGAPTWATLHMWMQMVGKIRLAQTPWFNHAWHVALYLTARGLTTSPIACGGRTFQIDFDFIRHQLQIQPSDGLTRMLALQARTVADFYHELLAKLAELAIGVSINATPCEVPDPVPFDRDQLHSAYDPEQARLLWRAMVQADRVLKMFRARFIGKCSPVHFFWGSFDLAVTRFSGRPASRHPGGVPHLADWIVREAYSHEVSSAGFWPGGDATPFPLFYSYAYPEPGGFSEAELDLPGAGYNAALREFVLPYDVIRQAAAPDALLLAFLERSYGAAETLGRWDRPALERGDLPLREAFAA
ncbi:DUF5996 family protein [Massilia glaciei]|uniref:DUF5996 family protein n=1 Tax=Massilia glaciei TaxID=1524097 RepID=UPI001C63AC99|nr:DUF5996 family protein [Massilia glaciei]